MRLALKYAIDREALLNTILGGHGMVSNDNPIGPANRFFASDIEPQHHYDPDQARHYLKQAGLAALKVDLHATDTAFNGALDTAVLFQAQAAKAGIEINVVREPEDGYWTSVWLKKPFCIAYWGGRPTADAMFQSVYAADSPWNDAHWKNARFNELLISARGEFDNAKRGSMYTEMQQIVGRGGGAIIPLYVNHVDARTAQAGPHRENCQ